MENKQFSIIFVKKEGLILLGLKKRGFGNEKWNGFGGKVEKGEDLLTSVVRELEEESTLIVEKEDLKCLGRLRFDGPIVEGHNGEVYIFVTNSAKGEPKETDEMIPKWFPINSLPYQNMWPDAQSWVKFVLEEQYFDGNIIYEPNEYFVKNRSIVNIINKTPLMKQ